MNVTPKFVISSLASSGMYNLSNLFKFDFPIVDVSLKSYVLLIPKRTSYVYVPSLNSLTNDKIDEYLQTYLINYIFIINKYMF